MTTARESVHILSLVALLGALVLLVVPAHAADLRTEVGARRVGVGQAFQVSVTAVKKDGEPDPESPRLTVKGAATVQGPSISSQSRIMMRNFNFDAEQSVVATWVVTPTKTGNLVVGPGTFQVGGKILKGESVTVEVVEEAQVQPRRSPFGPRSIFGRDPFDDPFGDFPDLDDVFQQRRQAMRVPPVPPEYLAPSAPDATAFLHVTLDKERVVLGEPVRLIVLAYGSRGNFREVSPNEPSLADFLSYSVIESSADQPTYVATVDGTEYLVRKLREYILIPLKTGDLPIGSMTAVLQGARGAYPVQGSPLGLQVVSPQTHLTVVEPPTKGRPTGYFPGDVGVYDLKVEVSPRQVVQGEFIQVLVQVRGKGQIPSRVLLPESRDATWEPPTVTGGPEIKDDDLQGVRTLEYTVQVHTSGSIDLGEVTLPYFDHERGSYQTAKASLGRVQVAGRTTRTNSPPNGPVDSKPEVKDDKGDGSGIPLAPRSSARPYSEPRNLTSVASVVWGGIWGLPALVLLLLAMGQVGRALQNRQKTSDKGLFKSETALARGAIANGNDREAVLHLERALYDALLIASGRNVRGSLRDHVARELIEAGLEPALADESQQLLSLLDQVRYDSKVAQVGDLLDRVVSLGARLLSKKRVRPQSARGALA